MSRKYQYYWYNIPSDMKFDKNNATIQEVSEAELRKAIGLYLLNLEQRNELDSIPRLLSRIKRYTISESSRNVSDDEIWLEGQMNSKTEPKGLVPKLEEALESIEQMQLDDAVKIYIGDNFELGEGQWEDKSFIQNLYLDIDPKEQSWKVEDIIDESQHAKFRQDPLLYSDSELSAKQQRIINNDSEAPVNLSQDTLKKGYDKESIKITKEIDANKGKLTFWFDINFMDTEFHKKELREIFPQQKIIFLKDMETVKSDKPSTPRETEIEELKTKQAKRSGQFSLEPSRTRDATDTDSATLKHNAEISESWLFNALGDDAKEGLKEWAQSEIIPIPDYVMHGSSDNPVWLPKNSATKLRRKVKVPTIEHLRWELDLDNKDTAFNSFWDLVEEASKQLPKRESNRIELSKWKAQHLQNLQSRAEEGKSKLQFGGRLGAVERNMVTALMNKDVNEQHIGNFIETLWEKDILYNQFLLTNMPMSLTSLGDYTITITLEKTVDEEPTAEISWVYQQQQTLNTGFLTAIGGVSGLSRPKFNFGSGQPQHARRVQSADSETDPDLKDRRKQASLGYNKVRDFLAKHVTARHIKIRSIINTLKEED